MADPAILSMAKALAKGLEISRNFNYANLAAFTAVYFDWLLTFDSEVKLIWNAQGAKMKILYLFTRYLPLAYSPPYLYYRFGNSTSSECTALYKGIGSAFGVSSICAALVVTIRTWAVWGMNKPITYTLFGTYTVAASLILGFFAVSLKYTTHDVEATGILKGCIPDIGSLYLPASFVVHAAYDAIILLLMLIRAALLFVSITNVVLLFNQGDYEAFMLPIQGAIRSISACRILLHVRMQYEELQLNGLSNITSCPTVVHIERGVLESRDE
ncbi:hypothetical protein AGABI1DRAFT_131674 [Agaricus bisporus var. burnettii JB137-S8]|uniref:DUF6533 domain-containing protein n=1 Tax=Agaricus bisporus var. burnettii (strain JB137-S8 / ATCC MYA-4627 / FGSC 10392) TaxID=597362 RepID=K5WZA2_AGABU|nr:uncharacterized protein AGABI1DRAFT_131674 [Agaricus bisporus var. burnettii JB137-S8]EKM75952.1 hypothetical protein AGABI1DRAFT_131674 [Agaricus bisporus var. burnettii JB137-S8]